MAAAPRAGTHTELRFDRKDQIKSADDAALHFRKNATPHRAKSITYVTSTRANCRRWVKAAQASGDLAVLVERGRRALRVHLKHVDAGLEELSHAIDAALE